MYVDSYRNRPVGSAIAGITVVVYFGLVCLVAMCAVAMPMVVGSGEHAHHDHDAAHSSLCAWACQATSQGGLPISAPAEFANLVTFASIESPGTPFAGPPSALLPSRAPPVPLRG